MPRRPTKMAPSPTPITGDVQGQSPEEMEIDTQFEIGEGSAPPIKKNRGPTKMAYIWKCQPNDKIVVTVNPANQLVGKEASTFANFIGVIARNGQILPLSYDRWSKIPATSKTIAINTIKQKFQYPDNLDKKWLNKSMGKKWRDWKCELKAAFFDENKSAAENARVVPPNVNHSDWHYLVHFLSSLEGKKRSEIGSASRGKQDVLHTAGTSSFAIVRERLVEEHGADKFGDLDFFDATHKKSDGQFVSTTAAMISSTARVKYAELSSTMAPDSTTSDFDTLSLQRHALIETRGPERPDRVRGMGLGPTPTEVFKARASSAEDPRDEEIRSLRSDVSQLEEVVAALVRQQNPEPAIPTQFQNRVPTNSSLANPENQSEHDGSNDLRRRTN